MKDWLYEGLRFSSKSFLTRLREREHIVPQRESVGRASLVRMLNESRKLGATEVFLGNPLPNSFQFSAQDKQYDGTVPKEALLVVKDLLAVKSPVTLNWNEVEVAELKVGLTKGGSRPIYCFFWDNYSRVSSEDVPDAESGIPPLVLLVDDDPRFSQILSRILKEHGFSTLLASDGNQGLELLEANRPSVVITDIHMPNLTGPEFLLEGRKRGLRTPYVVLTNDEDALTEAQMILLGASGFVRKSEDPRILLAWCKRLTTLRPIA